MVLYILDKVLYLIMYMKKFIICVFLLCISLFWIASSQTIALVPQWEWTFLNWCDIPVDVYIDTNWQEISAIDLMMETSLDYVDFVPSEIFPYFFKPVIKSNWMIHIVGFTVDPSERVVWSWKLWTLHFSQNNWSSDWIVKLYFLWEWETVDTNLSIAWWVDVLKSVSDAYMAFPSNFQACENNIKNVELANQSELSYVSWWFSNLSYDDVLDQTVKKINKTYGKSQRLFAVIMILLWLIVLVLLMKVILLFWKKSNKWKKE